MQHMASLVYQHDFEFFYSETVEPYRFRYSHKVQLDHDRTTRRLIMICKFGICLDHILAFNDAHIRMVIEGCDERNSRKDHCDSISSFVRFVFRKEKPFSAGFELWKQAIHMPEILTSTSMVLDLTVPL